MTGKTTSTSFPTLGAFQTTPRGPSDAFVTKLNPSAVGAASLVYSTLLGGSDQDEGHGIAVDSSGNAYVTGVTQSTDFPTTPGAFQTTRPSSNAVAFVTKLNPTGSALVYSTYLAGQGGSSAMAIAVDTLGNAYVTGNTGSNTIPFHFVGTDFPTTPGAFLANGYGAFVTKLDPSASGAASLVYSTYLGVGATTTGNGIAVDSSGNAYVTGVTQTTDFPTTPMAFQTSAVSNAITKAFVTKLNPSASGAASLVYSTYLSGSASSSGNAIAVDSSGNAYVTGGTQSTDFPTTPGAFQATFGGSTAFVTKLNPSAVGAASLVYSTYLGGRDISGQGIAVDPSGNAYVTGVGSGTFVKKLNPTGSALVYSTDLNSYFNRGPGGIAVDASPNPNAYVTGVGASYFTTTPGAFQTTVNNAAYASFAFFAKIAEALTADQTITFGPLSNNTFGDPPLTLSATASSGLPVSFSSNGNCLVSGSTVTLTGAGSCTITASQSGNASFNPAPSVSQSFTIAKATPVITWTNPTDIIFGTALSATQLNATANVPGSFAYTPAAGTGLKAGPGQTVSVIFTPTDAANYTTATKSVTINVLKATPTFSNLSSPTIVFGQTPTVLSGIVNAGVLIPTGSVVITLNGVPLSAPIQGNGSFSSSFSTGGLVVALSQYIVTYSYSGDANFNGVSPNGTGTLTVTKARTTTVLSAAPNPSNFGQSVTLTVSVAPVAPGAGIPTRNVTFLDGSVMLGTSPLSTADTASFSTSSLAPGNHSLTAAYGGDSNFANSSSSVVTEQVVCGVLINLSSPTAPPGGMITVTGKVLSCANTAQTLTIKFSLSGPSQPNSCSSTQSVMFTTPPFTLAANTSQTVSFPFWVPRVCTGIYSISATTQVNGTPLNTSTASLTITAP